MFLRGYDLEKIISHYGENEQLIMAMEECAELIQAISKCRRYPCYPSEVELQCEIADVLIMIEQLKLIYGIPNEVIEYRIDEKLDRQLYRMENKK